MKLGKAVADVVEHLQLNPPVILKITDPVIQKLQARQSHSRNNSLTPLDQPFQLDLPPIPSSFIENQTMSKEEIQILLQDEKANTMKTIKVKDETLLCIFLIGMI